MVGDSYTVRKASVDVRSPYNVVDISSYRQVIDVGNWDQIARREHHWPVGQHHEPALFRSEPPLDRGRLPHVCVFTRSAVEKASASRLLLTP